MNGNFLDLHGRVSDSCETSCTIALGNLSAREKVEQLRRSAGTVAEPTVAQVCGIFMARNLCVASFLRGFVDGLHDTGEKVSFKLRCRTWRSLCLGV